MKTVSIICEKQNNHPKPNNSKKKLTGSSNCTPMSAIATIAYETIKEAGIVEKGPSVEYIVNGSILDHKKINLEVCLVKV